MRTRLRHASIGVSSPRPRRSTATRSAGECHLALLQEFGGDQLVTRACEVVNARRPLAPPPEVLVTKSATPPAKSRLDPDALADMLVETIRKAIDKEVAPVRAEVEALRRKATRLRTTHALAGDRLLDGLVGRLSKVVYDDARRVRYRPGERCGRSSSVRDLARAVAKSDEEAAHRGRLSVVRWSASRAAAAVVAALRRRPPRDRRPLTDSLLRRLVLRTGVTRQPRGIR